MSTTSKTVSRERASELLAMAITSREMTMDGFCRRVRYLCEDGLSEEDKHYLSKIALPFIEAEGLRTYRFFIMDESIRGYILDNTTQATA